MRSRTLTRNTVLLLTLITAFSNGVTPNWISQAAGESTGSTQNPGATPEDLKKLEAEIIERDKRANGITVQEPKVYDDLQLQQMLQNAASRLASMQVLDQSGIAAKFGAITGATQQISSFGLNVQGPSLPGTVTTANDANGNTVNTTDASGTKSVVTSNLPTRGVVTTSPAATPPPVTAPAPSTTLPSSSFSVSASDILNEQMQLTSEIANLRLLLEGSLSDRYIKSSTGIIIVKPRTTIGFSIALDPDKRYRNAVAVVEVIVKTKNHLGDREPPAITALLPREKTYNVAAITDRSTSIGGGVVTQILGVSASLLRGRKTYYLVKDQDTVATTFEPEGNTDNSKVGFVWQFRPVLGRDYVYSGLKQTFVQLAFPEASDQGILGATYVRTYWRRYDSKKGIANEVIPGSVRVNIVDSEVRTYPLIVKPRMFLEDSLEDLGGGQMLVKLSDTNFLNGTYVRIGSTILTGPPNLSFEPDMVRFIAPIADLAMKKVYIVGRNGKEIPLEFGRLSCDGQLNIDQVDIKTVDQANSIVQVKINNPCFISGERSPGANPVPQPPLVLVIGNRVFGYSDAPIQRDAASRTLSAVVPTALLIANPKLIVQSLFNNGQYYASKNIGYKYEGGGSDTQYLVSQTERLVFAGQNPGTSKYEYLLYGNRLARLRVLDPPNSCFAPLPPDATNVTFGKIELTAGEVNTQKFVLLQRPGERPFTVQIPAPDIKDPVPDLKPTERVVVGVDETVISGDGLKDLTKVTFNGVAVTSEKATDNKSVTLKGLSKNGVTATPTIKTLVFWFNEKKIEVKLEVVNVKVESLSK